MKNEWIDLNLPFGRVYGDDGKDLPSAQKEGIISPGTLIEFADSGEQMLVGNVNVHGGLCDDCCVERERIVRRYKVVWEGG